MSDHFYVRGATVSEEFRREVLQLHPQLAARKWWFGFFELLCFNTFYEEGTRRQVIPFGLIRVAVGLPPETKPKDFPTGKFLEDFRANVLPDMVVGAHVPCRGARTIIDEGFSSEMRRLLDRELRDGHRAASRVNFLTGKKVPSLHTNNLHLLERTAASQHVSPVRCEAAQRVVAYMNVPRMRLFSQKFRENRDAAFAAALRIDEGRVGPSRIHAELRLLNRIALQPQPFYGLSKTGNTVRVSALNPSIVRLSNPVKSALISGWATYDLRHAQLAILATDWGLTDVVEQLRDPAFDLWGSLTALYPCIDQRPAKRCIKEALYSLCYGAGKSTILDALETGLGVDRRIAARFFKHPIAASILGQRGKVADAILEAGGVEDCFGRAIPCTQETEVLSVMAQVSQSREMQLLLPAIDVAQRRRGELVIALWEHDGFSAHLYRRPETNGRLLVEAVDRACATQGYQTRLTRKD